MTHSIGKRMCAVGAASDLMAWPCSLPEAQAEMAPAYDAKLGAQPPLCDVLYTQSVAAFAGSDPE